MESIGFKEWSVVCDALGRGEQSLILRKSGMAEGRGGFSFRHREFFLFPTFFHEQLGKVRNRSADFPSRSDEIAISLYVTVARVAPIDSLETAEALTSLHVLATEVVRGRFDYKGEGLKVVRVHRLERPWIFANEKKFGGCRSWVNLPHPPELAMQPVIIESTHEERLAKFDAIMSPRRHSELSRGIAKTNL